MNYQQTIDFLYNTLPMFSRMGSAAFKKDLDNIRILCQALDNPQEKFRSIHVGGTNGKGSVSHMLSAVFQEAGYKTGLYTSPHLYDFRERIKINGEMAGEQFVVDFVERIKPLIESIQPSFFEITVALAFEYFAVHKVDIAIVEVGLGGRLDSTNIITPELSIITNIGWDHMNMLGNTLEEIAMEKAGIIKEKIPVVIGERQEGLDQIFSGIAGEKDARISFASDHFISQGCKWNQHIEIDIFQKLDGAIHTWHTDLLGIYQTKNIATVLQSLEILKLYSSFSISETNARKGLMNVKKLTGLQGRWDVLQHYPTVVLEVAHNKEGIQQMLQHLKYSNFEKLHLVFGMVKDKEVEEVLKLLPEDATYYFTQAHIPRALDAIVLRQKASTFSLRGHAYPDVNMALGTAMQQASSRDMIIVCGSIFLVAEVDRYSISKMA